MIESLKRHKSDSFEEFAEHLQKTIEELNKTHEGNCWICGQISRNWGVIVPDKPDGLGLGAGESAAGSTNYRLAFFPYCSSHNLNAPDSQILIKRKLDELKATVTN